MTTKQTKMLLKRKNFNHFGILFEPNVVLLRVFSLSLAHTCSLSLYRFMLCNCFHSGRTTAEQRRRETQQQQQKYVKISSKTKQSERDVLLRVWLCNSVFLFLFSSHKAAVPRSGLSNGALEFAAFFLFGFTFFPFFSLSVGAGPVFVYNFFYAVLLFRFIFVLALGGINSQAYLLRIHKPHHNLTSAGDYERAPTQHCVNERIYESVKISWL